MVMSREPGFKIDGPLGKIAIAAAEHKHNKQSLSSDEKRALAFFTATFSMLAKMATADGTVSLDEIEAVDQIISQSLGLDHEARRFAIRVFTEAKSAPHSLKHFASEFRSMFKRDDAVRVAMYEILLRVASADGTIDPTEERKLKGAKSALRVPDSVAEYIRKEYTPGADRSYAILRSEPGAPMAEVEASYQALVKEWDPHSLTARGVPEEFTNLARKKLQEIEEAFADVERRAGGQSDAHGPDPSEDLKSLLTKVAADQDNAALRLAAGHAADREGLAREAILQFDVAFRLGIAPEDRRAFMLAYGSNLRNVGRVADSLRVLREALTHWPQYRPLRCFFALSLHAAGDRGGAVAELLHVINEMTADEDPLASFAHTLKTYETHLRALREIPTR